ncbi:DUF2017 family protein (plasmid) [Coraliomargarita sp. W4R53]
MSPTLVMAIARVEAAHLAGLVGQFVELLDEPHTQTPDPAVMRLVPDAYRDDPEAAKEFRGLTESDLLDRRRHDATLMLVSLNDAGDFDSLSDDPALIEGIEIVLIPPLAQAWMRTLAALRLVLATRLGVAEIDDARDPDDLRFEVYDWVGYRLHLLIEAIEESGETTEA